MTKKFLFIFGPADGKWLPVKVTVDRDGHDVPREEIEVTETPDPILCPGMKPAAVIAEHVRYRRYSFLENGRKSWVFVPAWEREPAVVETLIRGYISYAKRTNGSASRLLEQNAKL